MSISTIMEVFISIQTLIWIINASKTLSKIKSYFSNKIKKQKVWICLQFTLKNLKIQTLNGLLLFKILFEVIVHILHHFLHRDFLDRHTITVNLDVLNILLKEHGLNKIQSKNIHRKQEKIDINTSKIIDLFVFLYFLKYLGH